MGEAAGSGNNNNNSNNSGKPQINGVYYDFVTHIDVNDRDGRIALGFNKDDDPKEVARNWCITNSVDLDLAPQIMEHLIPMVDPMARDKRVVH